jgi:hypothetical protein
MSNVITFPGLFIFKTYEMSLFLHTKNREDKKSEEQTFSDFNGSKALSISLGRGKFEREKVNKNEVI